MPNRNPSLPSFVAWLGCCVAGLALAGDEKEPLFTATWRGFDTGIYPRIGPVAFAFGDLNGDGHLDALTGRALGGGPGISVLLGDGEGRFAAPVHYDLPAQQSVGDVYLSDMDGDGDLDAFATMPDVNGLTNKFAVWRNGGDGTLAARVEYPSGPGPRGIVVSDFSGDGFADVLTADTGYIAGDNSTVSLMAHNGQAGSGAGFLPPVNFPAGGARPEKLAAADLDGDLDLDVAVVRVGQPAAGDFETDIIHLLFNDGAGKFGPPVTYLPVPDPHRGGKAAIALADLDNDLDVDLIGGGGRDIGSISVGMISIRRNDGTGAFGEPELYQFENFVWVPSHLTTGDVNGDGFLDVVACSPEGRANDGWNLLESDGIGGFLEPVVRHQASKETWEAAILDLDEDGDPDVATLARDSAVITVHANPGDGTFPIPTTYPIGVLSEFFDAGDLDSDGDLDLASSDEQVRILRNAGAGSFAPFETYDPPINPADIKLRDLDSDGQLDLLMGPDGESSPYHFATALNNGDGTFGPGVVHLVFSCGEGSIDAFDLDGDGDLDVALTEEEACVGGDPLRIFLYRNDGNQVFVALPPLFPPGIPNGIRGTDLNHDGNVDLLTGLGSGIGVYLGNGDFTFAPVLVSGSRPFRFDLADFNHDSEWDLGMLLPQDSFGTVFVGIALGNGDGTFAAALPISGATGLESAFRISNDIDAEDCDFDGNVDLIASNNSANDLSVFLGNGDETAQPHLRYGSKYSPRQSIVADFTGDLVPEIVSMIDLPPSGFACAVVVARGLSDPPGTGSVDPAPTATGVFALPNPSSGMVTFRYAASPDGPGQVRIVDPSGKQVRVLSRISGQEAGHDLLWDGRDDRGEEVKSGIYFYRMSIAGNDSSGKIVIIR